MQWLSEGAPYGDPVSGMVTKLEIEPKEFFAEKVGPNQRLKVVAHYADGATREVAYDEAVCIECLKCIRVCPYAVCTSAF